MKEKIIVSFTSYPKRIRTVYKVLNTIVKQTTLPDKIILYLSLDEFKGEMTIPDFEYYKGYGFEIHWVEGNLKSHKKYFYAFQEYPDDIIITIDDDLLYAHTALEKLLFYHREFPKAVIARRAHLIACDQLGFIAPYDDWYYECEKYVGVPRMDLLATGGAGALYPPHIFTDELFNTDVILKECMYADDIWLKVMEVYNGIPVVLAERTWDDSVLQEQQVHCLCKDYNNNGGNDRQLKLLLKRYPYTADGKRKLTDSIFERGKPLSAKALEAKKQEEIHSNLLERIQTYREVLIYGAGKAGCLVYNFLKGNHMNIIKAFLVRDTMNNPDFINNIPVKDYKEFIQSHEKIIIALLDNREAKTVCEMLTRQGVHKERLVLLSDAEKEMLLENYRRTCAVL